MNLRDVRKKIKTVKNVKKITNAMQMVSAVKMKKSQKLALEGREYRSILDMILQKIMTSTPDINDLHIPWLTPSQGTKTLYILITSNKGLCGAFHTNVFKHMYKECSFDQADFITIGQKGAQFIAGTQADVLADFSSQSEEMDTVSAVFSLIEEKYLSGGYGSVKLIYNKFISSFRADPTIEQLLPVVQVAPLEVFETKQSATYIIEPSVEQLLGPLLLDYLKEKMRSAIADSEAAEHSARMMAMKTATDNAGEVADGLTLLRNKLRQTQITNELLDMIAAMST